MAEVEKDFEKKVDEAIKCIKEIVNKLSTWNVEFEDVTYSSKHIGIEIQGGLEEDVIIELIKMGFVVEERVEDWDVFDRRVVLKDDGTLTYEKIDTIDGGQEVYKTIIYTDFDNIDELLTKLKAYLVRLVAE